MADDRDEALVQNAADAGQVRSAGAKQKRQRRMLDQAYAEALATRWGKILLGALLEDAGVFRTPFDDNPLVMAFKVGEQNRGLKIMSQIDAVSLTGVVDITAFYRKEMKNA